MTNTGKIVRLHIRELPTIGRNTQGVRLVNVSGSEEKVISFCIADEEIDDETTVSPLPPQLPEDEMESLKSEEIMEENDLDQDDATTDEENDEN